MELAHWSELFLDDDFVDGYDSYVSSEEGMVEYISRKHFLTEEISSGKIVTIS